MELLKQPLGNPLSMAEQVIILVSANAHVFSDLEVGKIKQFQTDLLADFHTKHSEIISQLEASKDLSEDVKEAIIEAANAFKNHEE